MEKIFLVDATTYNKEIDGEFKKLKEDYFRIKHYKRSKKIPSLAPKTKTFSVGLLRLVTLLRYNRFDAVYVYFDELEKYLKERALPDIIAFSAVCSTVPMCHQKCIEIKKMYPSIRIVIGGPQVNVAPKMTKKLYFGFDQYIAKYDIEAASTIVGSTVSTLKMPPKYIDYNFLPTHVSKYAINIFTALGCRYGCDYCQDSKMPYFESSLTGSLEQLINELPCGAPVHCFDSNFGYSNERALKSAIAISSLNHSFILSCDMRPELVTPKLVETMSRAGFKEIRMGIECTDERVLEKNSRTAKLIDLDSAIYSIRQNSDIYITLYSIVGLPGSTHESFERDRSFYKELLSCKVIDEIKNTLFVPYPQDSKIKYRDGMEIIEKDWVHYDRQSKPVYQLDGLTSDDIWKEYLNVAKAINESWLKGLGIAKLDDLPDRRYPEYISDKYGLRKEAEYE